MLELDNFTDEQLRRARSKFATFGDWDRFGQVGDELARRGAL